MKLDTNDKRFEFLENASRDTIFINTLAQGEYMLMLRVRMKQRYRKRHARTLNRIRLKWIAYINKT